MMIFRFLGLLVATPLVVLTAAANAPAQDDLQLREEEAMKQAVARVAPSVVRIETVGGLERVGNVLIGTGPTTGLVVSEDGFIISSAFNFAQKPSSILVGLSDGTRTPAKLVATDHQRMLVLLKITVEEKLPVPDFVPEDQMQVGQWALAVGRTFESAHPNVSVGIVSALNRVWGKALQTDAKVSPANYGGPLVDIRGRVLGVLAPLSPQSTGEVAGVEWYDSGIGFAVPLAHVNRVLPKLKAGEDLHPGIMGISLTGKDIYNEPATVMACRPNSPAAKAGFKASDRIVEIDGQPIERQAQLRQQINRHYAGDSLHVVVMRDKERIERDVTLVDHLAPYQRAFLGVLPRRDLPATDAHVAEKGTEKSSDKPGEPPADKPADQSKDAPPENAKEKAAEKPAGVVVRYVYPGSPADKVGVKAGDTIVSVDGAPVANREALLELAGGLEIDQHVALVVRRGEETIDLKAQLVAETADVPAELPPPRERREKVEGERPHVGSFAVKIPEFANNCLAYVPEDYDPQVQYGVVVWLHPPGGFKDDELVAQWKERCGKNDLILLAPKSADSAKWLPTEAAFVRKAIDEIRNSYHCDPARIVVYGQQAGGSLAYLLAFANREVIRGVAAVDAPLMGRALENDPADRLAFFVTTAKNATFAAQITAGIEQLEKFKYTVTVKDQGESSRPLSDDELAELLRWIDSLDKI
jgi:serine protease Do